MEPLAKIVNGFHLLNIFAKCSILDVWQGCDYASQQYDQDKRQIRLDCVMKHF